MTLLEMRDKRGLLITDNAEMTVKIEKEKRKLTEDEQKLFDTNLETIAQLEKDILVEEELRKVEPSKAVLGKNLEEGKPFSLFGAINNKINQRAADAPTLAMMNEGKEEFRKSELQANGDLILPMESKIVKRTAIVAGGTTTGGYIVATDKAAVLPPLTNYLVLTQAGATYLTGLVGSVSIPTYSGTTVAWKEETVSAADGAGTWG